MVIKSYAFLLFFIEILVQGDPCISKSGLTGSCVNIERCKSAIDDLKKRLRPQICGFEGTNPMVCCMDSPESVQPTIVTTMVPRPPSTTSLVTDNERGCEPLSTSVTAPKTSRKACDKCFEYQERLVYPCVNHSIIIGPGSSPVRTDLCGQRPGMLIPIPNGATPAEYPHLVLLGFGETAQAARWICGGSIISESFVLTAGHCTGSEEFGYVNFIRLGVQNKSETVNHDQNYRVQRVINHPEYKPPVQHNDIALVETEIPIKLNHLTVPACLHIGDDVKDDEAIVVGWVGNGFKDAGYMQKRILKKMNDSYCSSQLYEDEGHRITVHKYNPETQLCYVHYAKDFCTINDGGPLLINNSRIRCMFTVIGVTAFAQACGTENLVYYTKVSGFVPWIESVVWPQN